MRKIELEPKFCLMCNKELNHIQILSKHKTCSKKCGYIYLSKKFLGKNSHFYKVGKITLKCKYCGGNFEIFPSELKQYSYKKNIRKYCSKICEGFAKTGKNNHNYKEFEPKFCMVCKKQLTKKQIIMGVETCSYKCGYLNRDISGEKSSNWKKVEQKYCIVCKKELTHKQIVSGCKTCGLECGYKLASKSQKIFYIDHPGIHAKEKHSNWKGGISCLPYALDFNKCLKNKIKERDNYKCMCCGVHNIEGVKVKLCIHHIDYNKLNSNDKNLITLCYSCNSKVNFNREYWNTIFNGIMIERSKNGLREGSYAPARPGNGGY